VNHLNDQEEVNFRGLQNFHLQDLIKKNHVMKVVHRSEQNRKATDHLKGNQILDLGKMEWEVPHDSKKRKEIPRRERIGFQGQEISPSHALIEISRKVKENLRSAENPLQGPSAIAKHQDHSRAKETMIEIHLLTKNFLKEKMDFRPIEKRNFLNRSKNENKELIDFQNSKKRMKNLS